MVPKSTIDGNIVGVLGTFRHAGFLDFSDNGYFESTSKHRETVLI
jgi:hypothetical protein